MIGFLDFKEERIIKILISLTINQEKISLENIMRFNECSQRTVYFDLEEIQKRWGHFIEIQSRGQEYELCTKNVGNVQDVLAEMLSESIQFLLLFEILTMPHQAQDYYCSKLKISVSMFERAMRRTNNQIEKYSARIRSRDGKYFIQADNELVFRLFLVEALHNSESKMTIFSDECIEDAIKISEYIIEEFNMNHNEIIIYYLSLSILISILREQTGFPIRLEKDIYNHRISLQHIIFECDEFIAIPMQVLEESISKVITEVVKYAKNDKRLEVAKLAASRYWDNSVNNTSESEKALFISSLQQFINFTRIYPYHTKEGINRFSLYGVQFLEMNPGIYEYIEAINLKYHVWEPKEFERYVYILVFWMSVNSPRLDLSVKETILILSDYGKEHAEVIKGIVEKFLENKIYICEGLLLPNAYRNLEKLNDKIDLIITNRYSSYLEGKNYVIVNDYPNERDIKAIQDRITKRVLK